MGAVTPRVPCVAPAGLYPCPRSTSSAASTSGAGGSPSETLHVRRPRRRGRLHRPGNSAVRMPVNLVCDPATLVVAWSRMSRNRGSRTAGVDAATRRDVEARGVEQFLWELH